MNGRAHGGGGDRGTVASVKGNEALRLRHQGHTFAQIAAHFGVSRQTIMRWTNPEYAERQRLQAAAAKRRRGGVCADCGGRTSLGNGERPAPAERCISCRILYAQNELRFWTRERALDAARQWANEHGQPPTANDWMPASPERRYPNSRECYGHGTLAKREGWKTWNDFLASAGLPVWRRGQHGATARTAA